MSEKDFNKDAFKQAEKEFFEKKIKEVKGYIIQTLESIEDKKKEKEVIEEELRVLKLDLEDLRNGKFDKIKERQEKSAISKKVSVYIIGNPYNYNLSSHIHYPNYNWQEVTSGTYTIQSGKSFYF